MMTRICPACGAELPSTSTVCEYCGSSIIPLALSAQDHKRIQTFAQEMNDRLVQETKRTSSVIFSIYTVIMLVVLFSLFIVYYIYQFSFWNLILLLLAIITLAYLVLLTINRRKIDPAFHRTFKEEINPDLIAFLHKERLPRWQFDQIAQQALKPGAPLKRFLLGSEDDKRRNRGR